jgi:hypothetical protein
MCRVPENRWALVVLTTLQVDLRIAELLNGLEIMFLEGRMWLSGTEVVERDKPYVRVYFALFVFKTAQIGDRQPFCKGL